jgi:hypothetical protein
MDPTNENLIAWFWGTVTGKSIGWLLKPTQLRREGKANTEVKRNDMLIIAQAEKDAEAIRLGRARYELINGRHEFVPLSRGLLPPQNDTTTQVSPEPPSLVTTITNNLVADTLRKEVNVAKAVLQAEAVLEGDPQEPPSSRVDEDWLYKWRDSVSDISSEELQELWGRLLAGEVKSPGKFSLRTLAFLRDLSKENANDIATLASFAIKNGIFRGDKQLLEEHGISYDFLFRMQELGVINGVEGSGVDMSWNSSTPHRFGVALTSHDKAIFVDHEDVSKKLTVPVYRFTIIGEEVLQLATFQANDPYLRRVGQAIKDQGFNVTIGRYEEVDGAMLRLFDREML